jgi:FkbM family methyltransferase
VKPVQNLRRLAATPPLNTVLKHRRVEPVVATFLRSSTVRDSARFALRELSGSKAVRRYRLRDAPFDVVIRHGSPDVATLGEVFYRRDYAFPPAVRRALEALERPVRILDVGANIGLFDLWALSSLPDAEITALEPDPWNLELLRRCASLNDRTGHWQIVEAAASTKDGTVPFQAGGVSLSRIDEHGGETMRVPAVDVFPQLERADLIKIDIEGGEWPILCDPRFHSLKPAALVLEFHPFMCPFADPGEAALSIVREAGREARLGAGYGPGQGMLWAWHDL